MKIATWNVNSLNVRLPHVLDWLKANPVDILGLQELKMPDEKFPREAFLDAGFNAVFAGQKTYNGVAIVSPHKIQNVQTALPNFDDESKRFIAADVLGARFVCVYVPNGADPLSDKFSYKKAWLAAFLEFLKNERAENLVIGGDFNIAPTDADVFNAELCENQICCTAAERAIFKEILAAGFCDTFRLLNDAPGHFSWWDYRQGAFHKNHGMRIDFLLTRVALAAKVKSATIDKTPRRLPRPSDHTPVIAEFDF